MNDAMMMSKKKQTGPAVDPGNIVYLSHFDQEPILNLADGKFATKTGTGTYVQTNTKKFGAGGLFAARFTVGDIKFPMRERLSADQWTIEGWVYYGNDGGSGTGRGARHFYLGYSSTTGGYGMELNFSSQAGARMGINIRSSATYSGNEQRFQTAVGVNHFSKRWGHFAVVFDKNKLRAYIGGKKVFDQTGVNRPDDAALQCMMGYTGSFDSCYFDEWRITNNQALYIDDFSPPDGPFTELDPPPEA